MLIRSVLVSRVLKVTYITMILAASAGWVCGSDENPRRMIVRGNAALWV